MEQMSHHSRQSRSTGRGGDGRAGTLVESVMRAADILEVVVDSTEPITLDGISERLGLPRSTVHRLIRTLQASDLICHEGNGRGYRLGNKVLKLGMAYLGNVDVRGKARPYMVRLRQQSGETVGLTIRVGDARMYVEQLESPFELKVKAELGRPYPLYSGAPGIVLFSSLDDQEIDAILDRVDRRKILLAVHVVVASAMFVLATLTATVGLGVAVADFVASASGPTMP